MLSLRGEKTICPVLVTGDESDTSCHSREGGNPLINMDSVHLLRKVYVCYVKHGMTNVLNNTLFTQFNNRDAVAALTLFTGAERLD